MARKRRRVARRAGRMVRRTYRRAAPIARRVGRRSKKILAAIKPMIVGKVILATFAARALREYVGNIPYFSEEALALGLLSLLGGSEAEKSVLLSVSLGFVAIELADSTGLSESIGLTA